MSNRFRIFTSSWAESCDEPFAGKVKVIFVADWDDNEAKNAARHRRKPLAEFHVTEGFDEILQSELAIKLCTAVNKLFEARAAIKLDEL